MREDGEVVTPNDMDTLPPTDQNPTNEADDEIPTVEELMKNNLDILKDLAVDAGAVEDEDFNESTTKREFATFIIEKLVESTKDEE